MSEYEKQSTDILLPTAQIAVFSQDKETLLSTAALHKDWRYARVKIKAEAGGVDQAIETYKTTESPDLLIIQTETIDDAFTDKLGVLSGFCEENTAAIIIGPVNDVYLYRKMIQIGVSDYLVRPIAPDVFSEVIAKALIDRLGVSGSRLIAFIGAKGGVGTSVLTQIGALIASSSLGQKTLLMDAGGGWSPMSVGLGFDPSATLLDVARAVEGGNEDALKRVFYDYDENLKILASGADGMLDISVSGAQYEMMLDYLMVTAPLVFVDLSSSTASIRKAVIARAHHTFIVTAPTVTSLRFCRSIIKEISDVRGGETDALSLIVNKIGMAKGYEMDKLSDISDALEYQADMTIDFVPQVFVKYESSTRDLMQDKDVVANIEKLTRLIARVLSIKMTDSNTQTQKNHGLIGGLLSKMSS